MEKVKGYIGSLSSMLGDVFSETETTVINCSSTVTAGRDGDFFSLKCGSRMDILVSSLKESVNGISTLFQFGDIIDQSFESFNVIFEEINHFKNNEVKLDYNNAERFSRLIGAVSTNTFSLIGTTLLQLKEKLENAKKMLCLIKEEIARNSEKSHFLGNPDEFINSVNKSIEAVERNILKIETSARLAVLSTESVGLFCIETIASQKDNINNEVLTERLYEKFRVREHLRILNSIFPSARDYSETGSMEFF
ncbi:MAG TPA: hypothetical protein PKG52_03300 [bacterium]|nr:hypothetical protein [bacterium]HPS29646.1 hypothetical protein [bacterium]